MPRYEDIDQSRIRYEIRPDRTDDPAARSPDNVRDSRENSTQVWLPGIGVLYQVNDSLGLLGGVHKGFSAPPNAPGIKEEESINYEIGPARNNSDKPSKRLKSGSSITAMHSPRGTIDRVGIGPKAAWASSNSTRCIRSTSWAT